MGFPGESDSKESPWQCRRCRFDLSGWEDPLEKEMATHSSVLAWRIPGTGEPGGLPSMGSHRVRHDWSNLAAATHMYAEFRKLVLKNLFTGQQ